ncbi:hypothetical protein ADUPG1_008596 [Aduncisulcus paluster]|uniref:Uncharacterized protein n=1 Tax=Aduncisulcus paluster TaxID=2918883 RepID=A0ABQ5KSI9_9EUKA|nr:hypothetical protein ADUPG1_008596 [Aduncisulcus paluster]
MSRKTIKQRASRRLSKAKKSNSEEGKGQTISKKKSKKREALEKKEKIVKRLVKEQKREKILVEASKKPLGSLIFLEDTLKSVKTMEKKKAKKQRQKHPEKASNEQTLALLDQMKTFVNSGGDVDRVVSSHQLQENHDHWESKKENFLNEALSLPSSLPEFKQKEFIDLLNSIVLNVGSSNDMQELNAELLPFNVSSNDVVEQSCSNFFTTDDRAEMESLGIDIDIQTVLFLNIAEMASDLPYSSSKVNPVYYETVEIDINASSSYSDYSKFYIQNLSSTSQHSPSGDSCVKCGTHYVVWTLESDMNIMIEPSSSVSEPLLAFSETSSMNPVVLPSSYINSKSSAQTSANCGSLISLPLSLMALNIYDARYLCSRYITTFGTDGFTQSEPLEGSFMNGSIIILCCGLVLCIGGTIISIYYALKMSKVKRIEGEGSNNYSRGDKEPLLSTHPL